DPEAVSLPPTEQQDRPARRADHEHADRHLRPGQEGLALEALVVLERDSPHVRQLGQPTVGLRQLGPRPPVIAGEVIAQAPCHAALKRFSSPRGTGVSSRNLTTAAEGMMKLKPCTILLWASDDNVTNVSTPTTAPASLTAGPPLLPHAADASVWITGWFARSCLNPEP